MKPEDAIGSRKRILDPIERLSEVLFALIMALTFTGSLSVAEAGPDDVRSMLVAALGCNLAWGVIDSVMYLMGSLAEKGRGLSALRAVRMAADPRQAHRLIAGSLPPAVASVIEPAELEAIRLRLRELPEPPEFPRWDKNDWLGALCVFLAVFLATLPVVLPFVFMSEVRPAMRVSNAVTIGILFLAGRAFGRMTGRRPWAAGVSMVALGSVLVAMTIALGG